MPATTTHVRLLLLTAATALFVVVWIGDHPDRPSRSVSATMSAIPPAEPVFADEPADPFLAAPTAAVAEDGPREEGIPLPPEIVAGEYRIVAQDGTVSSLTLTAADLAALGYAETAPPRETYRIQEGTRVWHFVRIGRLEGVTATPAAVPPDAVELSELGTLLRPMVARITTPVSERLASWWSAAVSRQTAARRAVWDGVSTMAEEIGHALRRIDWSSRQAAADPTGRRS